MENSMISWQRTLEYFTSGDFDRSRELLATLKECADYRVGACLLDGKISEKQGDLEGAVVQYRIALAALPDDTTVLQILAAALLFLNRPAEAVPLLIHAAELNPQLGDTWINLSASYLALNKLTEAEFCCRRAVELENDCYSRTNLGRILLNRGLHFEAIEQFRMARQLNPLYTPAHSNLLLALCCSDGETAESIFREHLSCARIEAESITANTSPVSPAGTSADRLLRVGYVSPDFRTHSVGYFIESILRHHDWTRFELFCYSDVLDEDAVTQRFKGYSVVWRNVRKLDDAQLADLIRRDGIDILVDLAGHTADNRLLCFARKPAPVQVSWIGYPATTGLSAMGYRLVDAVTDPIDSPVCTSEQLVRLPGCFLCYQPPFSAPDVIASPFLNNGYITFGSFNNMTKITSLTLDIWVSVLQRIPNSRLLLKNKQLGDSGIRQEFLDRLGARGITSERVILHGPMQSSHNHLALYGDIDIALDTFPYNGATTTCESLFMGVPVITYAGATHAARVGASLLKTAGLHYLVADRSDEVANVAASLASDLKQLESLRSGMRLALLSSPLCDGRGFCKGLESIFLDIYKTAVTMKDNDVPNKHLTN